MALGSVSMDSMIVMFTAIPMVEAGVNIVACINDPVVNLAGNVSGPNIYRRMGLVALVFIV